MAVKSYKKGLQNYKISNNFSSHEFDCKGGSCCDTTFIDEDLIKYLQQIRDHFGKPVTISSAYRCAVHNKNVGGATGSQHVIGTAADISVEGVAPAEVAKYAESIGVLGIGLYETAKDGYFVHIDNRKTKSFWYGQGQAYRTTFGGQQTQNTASSTQVIQQKTMTQSEFNTLMDGWIAAQASKGADTWSKSSRQWSEKNGLTNGKSYKKYVTHEELVEVLYRALHRNFIE